MMILSTEFRAIAFLLLSCWLHYSSPLNPWLLIFFETLTVDWAGQIVGVFVFNGASQPESKLLINVMFTSRPYPRWLAETKTPTNTTLAAQVLVRRTLAWITGVVLLIATLLGVRSVLNIKLDASFCMVPGVFLFLNISCNTGVPS